MKKQSIVCCAAVVAIASAAGLAAAHGQGTPVSERGAQTVGIPPGQDRADLARLKKQIMELQGQKPRLEYELNLAQQKMESVNISLRMMYQRQAEINARLSHQVNRTRPQR